MEVSYCAIVRSVMFFIVIVDFVAMKLLSGRWTTQQ